MAHVGDTGSVMLSQSLRPAVFPVLHFRLLRLYKSDKDVLTVIGTGVGAAAKLTLEIIKRLASRSSGRQQRGAMQLDELG
jgi:hypothetical protein